MVFIIYRYVTFLSPESSCNVGEVEMETVLWSSMQREAGTTQCFHDRFLTK